jgi:hypothetical protein
LGQAVPLPLSSPHFTRYEAGSFPGSIILLSYLAPLRWGSGQFLTLNYCSHLRPLAEACYLCSFLWTSVVVLHIAQRVTRAKVGLLQTVIEHTICWGFPILFLILSFALPGFWESPSEAADWCRLNPLAEVIFWFVPLSVCIMFDFGVTGTLLHSLQGSLHTGFAKT